MEGGVFFHKKNFILYFADMSIEIEHIEIRHLLFSDYSALKEAMIKSYSTWEDAYWQEHHIQKLLDIFPMGQFVVVVNGEIAGAALSIKLDEDDLDDDHTYIEITGGHTFNTHNPEGNILYGIDVFIRPEYRGLRLGRRLYDARKEHAENNNIKSIVFGGRIPNYSKYKNELSPRDYIKKVRQKEIHDPVLNFQLSNDFHPRKILDAYIPADKESGTFAVLLEWDNIYYNRPKKKPLTEKSIVRLGLVQWQMRSYKGIEDLFEQIEFFVDAVSSYKSDFVLFPEYFNAPLMAKYNDLSEPAAVRELSKYTHEIRDKFVQLAMSYNINIITGSMPLLENDRLYNVGYLCHRSGNYDRYVKIHVTPDEAKFFGLAGGESVQVFNTDCGKVGILICYDVEFPELSRILASNGMQILFVPFMTDTQNGYSRVHHCGAARAIENECYVAIAGSVGNLPKVHNMDFQFSRAAVFTPCDFPFPAGGVKAEATPNTEMILIADVDLDLLKELHQFGNVRTIKDRRTDLYEVKVLKNNPTPQNEG